jgi:hypothetical protein
VELVRTFEDELFKLVARSQQRVNLPHQFQSLRELSNAIFPMTDQSRRFLQSS